MIVLPNSLVHVQLARSRGLLPLATLTLHYIYPGPQSHEVVAVSRSRRFGNGAGEQQSPQVNAHLVFAGSTLERTRCWSASEPSALQHPTPDLFGATSSLQYHPSGLQHPTPDLHGASTALQDQPSGLQHPAPDLFGASNALQDHSPGLCPPPPDSTRANRSLKNSTTARTRRGT
jgi:hypothetical protein